MRFSSERHGVRSSPNSLLGELSRFPLWSVSSLESLRSVFSFRMDADPHGGMNAFSGPRNQQPSLNVQDGIAIVDIKGLLIKDFSVWWMASTSMQAVGDQIVQAIEDPAVKGIFLDVDSPGGTVAGTQELGDMIAEANEIKPVHAQIGDQACSAGYWLASSAGSVAANRTAITGSIGVIRVIEDFSGMFDQAGIEVNAIRSGALKGGNQFGEKLNDAQRNQAQGIVDTIASEFFSHVQQARGFSGDEISAVSSGASFVAPEAMRLGLIDGISNRDEALAGFGQRATGTAMGMFSRNRTRGVTAQDKDDEKKPDEVPPVAKKKKAEAEDDAEGALTAVEGQTPEAPHAPDMAAELARRDLEIADLKARGEELEREKAEIAANQKTEGYRVEAQSFEGVAGMKLDDISSLLQSSDENMPAPEAAKIRTLLTATQDRIEATITPELGARTPPIDEENAISARAMEIRESQPNLSSIEAKVEARKEFAARTVGAQT